MDLELWLPALLAEDGELAPYVGNDGLPLRVLAPLSDINLFVGANNAGKSRLLRFLFKQPELWLVPAEHGAIYASAAQAISDLDEVRPSLPRHLEKVVLDLRPGFNATLADLVTRARGGSPDPARFHSFQRTVASQNVPEQVTNVVARLAKAHNTAASGKKASTHGIYIPALRTAARFAPKGAPVTEDVLGQVAQDRFFSARGGTTRRILSGIELYETLLMLMTGTKEQRDRVDAFEHFLSRTFFGNKSVVLRPRWTREPSTRTLELSVGNVERSLHELGDGLGALVLLLSPFFLEPTGTWVYIEEPELYLHPGFQRLFLETLGSKEVREREIVACMTTHSNHLLGVALDRSINVSVFQCSQVSDERFAVTAASPACLRALDALGVHNASVLLAGCSIWVEGVSDRDYVRAGLAAYAAANPEFPPLLEDLHYAFFEYAGSNIAHYKGSPSDSDDEQDRIAIQRLSNRIFLLFDRDESAAKTARYEAWQAHAADSHGACRVHRTEGIEIENELSPTVLRAALPKAFATRMKGRAFPDLPMEDYRQRRLGSLLDETFGLEPGTFAIRDKEDANSTLKGRDKVDLAASVLELVREGELTWEELGGPLQALTEAIVNFVRVSNHQQ